MLCPGCGTPVDPSIVFCAQCGYSIARRSEPLRYAGFLPRVAAAVIDFVLMTPLIVVLLFFTMPRVTQQDLAADTRVQKGADRSDVAWHRFLQQEMQISEEEAYLLLQRQSRQARKSMKDIAEAVVASREVKANSRGR